MQEEYILRSNIYNKLNSDLREIPSKLTLIGTNIAILRTTAAKLSTSITLYKITGFVGSHGLLRNSSRAVY